MFSSLLIHCLFTIYSLLIHCLSTVYSFFIKCSIVCSIDCLIDYCLLIVAMIRSLWLRLFTVFELRPGPDDELKGERPGLLTRLEDDAHEAVGGEGEEGEEGPPPVPRAHLLRTLCQVEASHWWSQNTRTP
jgi:hypothetical protein